MTGGGGREPRYQGFSIDSAVEFYVARDAIAVAIAEVGTQNAATELKDLQALLRAAFGISVVNELGVFDWLSWAEVWQSRIKPHRQLHAKRDLTFDLTTYDTTGYHNALVVASALPTFRVDARFYLEASGLSAQAAGLVIAQRNEFIHRYQLEASPVPEEPSSAPTPSLRTLPPTAADREVLDRLIAAFAEPSSALRVAPGTAEYNAVVADPYVAKHKLASPRSDGLSLNKQKLLVMACEQVIPPQGTQSLIAQAAWRFTRGNQG